MTTSNSFVLRGTDTGLHCVKLIDADNITRFVLEPQAIANTNIAFAEYPYHNHISSINLHPKSSGWNRLYEEREFDALVQILIHLLKQSTQLIFQRNALFLC